MGHARHHGDGAESFVKRELSRIMAHQDGYFLVTSFSNHQKCERDKIGANDGPHTPAWEGVECPTESCRHIGHGYSRDYQQFLAKFAI